MTLQTKTEILKEIQSLKNSMEKSNNEDVKQQTQKHIKELEKKLFDSSTIISNVANRVYAKFR